MVGYYMVRMGINNPIHIPVITGRYDLVANFRERTDAGVIILDEQVFKTDRSISPYLMLARQKGLIESIIEQVFSKSSVLPLPYDIL
ncbi:hypothetical protein [uncultured Duncaniella sp.]|uniref:hypothetical protein n=1 Tax=uncultured Duncaniella sp. TaxID=2768039 RepID=UPI0026223B9A|nr:hypothetical protein [uncultured Duncaniella sp.]